MATQQVKGSRGSGKTVSRNAATGAYTARKGSQNGSGYRSAKTGRYVSSHAPQISDRDQRTATVDRATKRVKTAVTVDLSRSRRSR